MGIGVVMRRIAITKENIKIESKKSTWHRRPSEIRGYLMTLYINTENGDYIRVDYNLRDKRVRVYIEDADEGGNPYYAVITNGRITSQRNASSGRPVDITDRIIARSSVISTLTNKEVLKIIKSTFKLTDAPEEKTKTARKKMLEQTRERYFRPEESGAAEEAATEYRPATRALINVLDFAIGAVLVAGLYLYFHSFIISGLVSALFGVVIGLVDLFGRGVKPSFVKMLFFIIAGLVMYIYGYYVF